MTLDKPNLPTEYIVSLMNNYPGEFFCTLSMTRQLSRFVAQIFEATDGLVWVVDCAFDGQKLETCAKEPHDLLKEERLAGASLLILANKQDLAGALTSDQIKEVLQLDKIKTHNWASYPVSAVEWIVNIRLNVSSQQLYRL